jgi:hypothetical protein
MQFSEISLSDQRTDEASYVSPRRLCRQFESDALGISSCFRPLVHLVLCLRRWDDLVTMIEISNVAYSRVWRILEATITSMMWWNGQLVHSSTLIVCIHVHTSSATRYYYYYYSTAHFFRRKVQHHRSLQSQSGLLRSSKNNTLSGCSPSSRTANESLTRAVTLNLWFQYLRGRIPKRFEYESTHMK